MNAMYLSFLQALNPILGHFDPIKESAVDFFCRIGEETNTSVIWPSRLKIGAKSKKGRSNKSVKSPITHVRVNITFQTLTFA